MNPQKPNSLTKAQVTRSYIDREEVIRQEPIRCRAFELYEQRGREDGHDLDDWIQAESEFVQQKAKAAGA
jgi:hypothetical protein